MENLRSLEPQAKISNSYNKKRVYFFFFFWNLHLAGKISWNYGAPCVCLKKHDTQDYDSLCTFFKTHKKVASECLESQCENSKASINIIRDAEVRSTTTSLRQNE